MTLLYIFIVGYIAGAVLTVIFGKALNAGVVAEVSKLRTDLSTVLAKLSAKV